MARGRTRRAIAKRIPIRGLRSWLEGTVGANLGEGDPSMDGETLRILGGSAPRPGGMKERVTARDQQPTAGIAGPSASTQSRQTPRVLSDLSAHRDPLLKSSNKITQRYGERLKKLQDDRTNNAIDHSRFVEIANEIVFDLFEDRDNIDAWDYQIANDDIGLQYIKFEELDNQPLPILSQNVSPLTPNTEADWHNLFAFHAYLLPAHRGMQLDLLLNTAMPLKITSQGNVFLSLVDAATKLPPTDRWRSILISRLTGVIGAIPASFQQAARDRLNAAGANL